MIQKNLFDLFVRESSKSAANLGKSLVGRGKESVTLAIVANWGEGVN